jgi:hypothetical protein
VARLARLMKLPAAEPRGIKPVPNKLTQTEKMLTYTERDASQCSEPSQPLYA